MLITQLSKSSLLKAKTSPPFGLRRQSGAATALSHARESLNCGKTARPQLKTDLSAEALSKGGKLACPADLSRRSSSAKAEN
jgi:hypothetical protein